MSLMSPSKRNSPDPALAPSPIGTWRAWPLDLTNLERAWPWRPQAGYEYTTTPRARSPVQWDSTDWLPQASLAILTVLNLCPAFFIVLFTTGCPWRERHSCSRVPSLLSHMFQIATRMSPTCASWRSNLLSLYLGDSTWAGPRLRTLFSVLAVFPSQCILLTVYACDHAACRQARMHTPMQADSTTAVKLHLDHTSML